MSIPIVHRGHQSRPSSEPFRGLEDGRRLARRGITGETKEHERTGIIRRRTCRIEITEPSG